MDAVGDRRSPRAPGGTPAVAIATPLNPRCRADGLSADLSGVILFADPHEQRRLMTPARAFGSAVTAGTLCR